MWKRKMKNHHRILIAEDELNMRRILAASLTRKGYSVASAANGREALEIMESNPADVIITDIKMPVMNGMELLEKVNTLYPGVPVIVITAHGTVENAVEAMKCGAFDYISKPFEMDELELTLAKACATFSLNQKEFLSAQNDFDQGFITANRKMKEILDLVRRVADSPSTILITGESGTGKELIAKMIHAHSGRVNKPFIKINCAAVPETLLESEFFGYEKGAFTGAVNSKAGRFELANHGTLFLDEIGEIPKEMQVKLLRALQEREFERVGGIKTIHVDVRLVVATNLDLNKAVAEGKFRQDLYYRLNVVPVHLPPLRDRPEDIPPLVSHFIRHFNQRLKRNIQSVTPEAMRQLVQYNWPGNIRELENIMERAILLSKGTELTHFDLIPEADTDGSGLTAEFSMKELVQKETERFEKRLLKSALDQTRGNVTRAAKLLGLSRKGLQLKMRKYDLHSGWTDTQGTD